MLCQTGANRFETVAMVEAARNRMDNLVRNGISNRRLPALLEETDGEIHLKSSIEPTGSSTGPGEPGIEGDRPDNTRFIPPQNKNFTDFFDLETDIRERPGPPGRIVLNWTGSENCMGWIRNIPVIIRLQPGLMARIPGTGSVHL